MTTPVSFSSIPNPGETPNPSAPGVNVYSFRELAEYSPEAVLYVALGNEDRNVRLKVLVDYILSNVEESQIPEDVVRRQEMEDFVTTAVSSIVIPEQEITNSNLGEKVAALESIINLSSRLLALEGRVDELTPTDMSLYVKVSQGTQRSKPLVLNESGELTHATLGSTRVFYVYKRNTPLANADGSLEAPFDDIQSAIDAIGKSISNSVILVQPSQGSNYAGFTIDNRINLTVMGYGCTDSHVIRIDGAVVNKGDGTRFRLKDVQLRQTDSNIPVYTNEGTQGRDYFKNVTMEATSSSQTTPLMVLQNVRNWLDFEDCNISGIVNIEGESLPTALVSFRTGNADKLVINHNSNAKLLINNNTRIGAINQTAGVVEVNYTHNFTGVNGVAINSTGGEISVSFSNLYKAGDSLKVLRHGIVSPIKFNHCAVDPTKVEGPKVFLETELMSYLTRPIFSAIVDNTDPEDRAIRVEVTKRNGYFYEELKGKILQVNDQHDLTNPLGLTEFILDGKETTIFSVAKAPESNFFYVVLEDSDSEGTVFTYGPFDNV